MVGLVATRLASTAHSRGIHYDHSNASPAIESNAPIKKVDFYEQSLRGTALQHESASTVKITVFSNGDKTFCTGYFLKNDRNQYIIASAGHCFFHRVQNLCKAKAFIVKAESGETGFCKRVVFSAEDTDLVLVEVDFRKEPQNVSPLVIGNFDVPINTRILAIGYPADRWADGDLRVSRNCWTTSVPEAIDSDWVDALEVRDDHDLWVRHNCSTYEGNSGGPVVLENSNIVTGYSSVSTYPKFIDKDLFLPAIPKDGFWDRVFSNTAIAKRKSLYNTWRSFLARYPDVIDREGLAVTNSAPPLNAVGDAHDYLNVLTPGRSFRDGQGSAFRILEVNAADGTIKVRLQKSNGEQHVFDLECGKYPDKSCRYDDDLMSLTIISDRKIIYDYSRLNSHSREMISDSSSPN